MINIDGRSSDDKGFSTYIVIDWVFTTAKPLVGRTRRGQIQCRQALPQRTAGGRGEYMRQRVDWEITYWDVRLDSNKAASQA